MKSYAKILNSKYNYQYTILHANGNLLGTKNVKEKKGKNKRVKGATTFPSLYPLVSQTTDCTNKKDSL